MADSQITPQGRFWPFCHGARARHMYWLNAFSFPVGRAALGQIGDTWPG
jgi:hypothetical protein